MKFLIDENIPFADDFFADLGTIERFPGRELTPQQLIDADVLLVRSITKVNQALLSAAKKLKFVGTATIGEDHIDKPYLAANGVEFSSAPGCNANSVAEYVISSLFVLQERYNCNFAEKTIAIVGVGNIGKAVKSKLDALGIRYLLVDPIRESNEYPEGNSPFVSLEQAIAEADIVTLHTPLTLDGEHPTMHLIDESKLSLLKPGAVLINACRGEVIDNHALLEHMQDENNETILVMDVWEGEPNPLPELIPLCDIASAHIAGYSLEGKSRGTEMLYHKVCDLFGLDKTKSLADMLPEAEIATHAISQAPDRVSELKSLVHMVYDVRRDDQLFRELLALKGFDWLRKNYPVRREWSSLQVEIEKKSTKSLDLGKIGFAI